MQWFYLSLHDNNVRHLATVPKFYFLLNTTLWALFNQRELSFDIYRIKFPIFVLKLTILPLKVQFNMNLVLGQVLNYAML